MNRIENTRPFISLSKQKYSISIYQELIILVLILGILRLQGNMNTPEYNIPR